MEKDQRKKTNLPDESRRRFMRNAGLAGVTMGAAAVLGKLSGTDAKAATGVKGGSVYESILGEDAGRIYAKKAPCPGPLGPIGFEDRDISGEVASVETCDVVVVGAGITGMMASLKAADMGKKVIVLEKMDTGRGCFESYAAVGSDVLMAASHNAGVLYDDAYKVKFMKDLYEAAQYRIRPEAVRTFVDRSGEAANFMNAMFAKGTGGLESLPTAGTTHECQFISPFMDTRTGSVPSGRQGMYVVRELAKVGKASYGSLFEIRYNSPAVQLVREGSGPVTGVIAKQGDRYIRIDANKGVILATGGYDANPSLMEAWVRSEDYATTSWWNPCWGTTGDGHMMGLKVGAAMDPAPHTVMNFNMGRASGYSGMGAWFLMALFGGIMVRPDGKRFVDETLPSAFDKVSNAMNAQAGYGKDLWMIIGDPQDILGPGLPASNFIPRQTDIDNGWGAKANSVSELAGLCGIDPHGLQDTVDKCNQYNTTGLDAEFGREVTVPVYRFKVDAAPYYALKARSNILATTSGLLIDSNCNVLDEAGRPIEGLYAGGNVSGGMFSGNYPRHLSGMSIGRALTFGYVSAEHACSRV